MVFGSLSRRIAICISLLAISLAGACSGRKGFDGAILRSLDAFGSARIATDTIPPEDAQVERLVTALDSLLALPQTPQGFESDALTYIRYFGTYLEMALLTDEQTAGVVARLDEIEARYPDTGEMIDDVRYRVANLMPGKVAPDIVGMDTEGVQFELTDYRDNIVVLIFSAEWCAPCKAEYPYQRQMLERYKDQNVVLLGVNSDDELETIREAKEREELDYRTWWDGSAPGPIASSWKVFGWPDIFVLDEIGVILHVNKRGDKLIEAVDAVLARRRPGGESAVPPSG